VRQGDNADRSSEAGVAAWLLLLLVVLAIIALTIWIAQQLT